MIRILVIDDHPVVREGLVAGLADDPELEVVGAAGSIEEALPLARARRPEVVLLDLELPGTDGLAGIPLLTATDAATRILILTAYDTDERVLGAIRGGAKGYVLKGAPLSEIARAIRAVHTGDTYLEPRIATKVVAALGSGRRSGVLSRREREVLRLIAAGQLNKQIAHTLGITERTVKFHVTSILNKLGAGNRAQAVALAGQRGLI